MDYQFWIWLIIIVITFLARARKQKPKPPPQREQESWEQEPAPPSSRPLTFDELLREIQAAKEPRRPDPPDSHRDHPDRLEPQTHRQLESAPPINKEVDYDDDLGEEEQDLETIPAGRDERVTMDVYEKAKQEAFHRPSLEETMKLEDTVLRFGAFKEYETPSEKSRIPAFLAELHDPEGLKKAFILSEILTRRV